MRARFGLRHTGEVMLLFLFAFGLLLTWTLAIARYGGPDEPAHVLRAASVARAEWVGSPVAGFAPGFRAVTVPAALATGDPSCFRHDARAPTTCAVATSIGGTQRAATSAGTYPPLYYVVVGVPVRLFGNPSAVESYRIVAALWSALVLVATMRRARRLSGSVLALAALTPATWFLFGVVNPNAAEIALMLLAWVGVARLRMRPFVIQPSSELLWFSVPISVAILIRPIAVLAWLAMLCVLCLDPQLGVLKVLKRATWRVRAAAFGAPLVAVVATLSWSWWSGVQINDRRTASHRSFVASMWLSMRGSGQTLREVAGSLGWLEFSSPTWTQVLWWLVVAWVVFTVWRQGRRGLQSWLVVLTLLLVSPVVFETLFAHRIGFVWQGRYSISVAMGLVVLAIDRPLPMVARRVRSAAVVTAVVFAIEVGTFAYVLRRYTVGINGSVLFRHAAWQPPASPLVLVGANAALLAALLIMHQRTSTVR